MARATRAHVPRRVTTNFPVTFAYSAGWQPRLTVPSGFRRTLIGRAVPSAKAAPFEFCMTIVEPVLRSARAARMLGTASLAATLIAVSAAAGSPVRYGEGPLFPADATTMTPAFAALSEAAAVAL